ncbi:hypothetical protein chiPu_0027216 [Chiloscyllium punctatum]|uniref:Uncharacterized protein n=1 Tax=Chiloscyllium punctatum TaxID=137246 RepID=A0A401TK18_CHIPU|nr:hypothetical protein [Chiloscyllium punctatum]
MFSNGGVKHRVTDDKKHVGVALPVQTQHNETKREIALSTTEKQAVPKRQGHIELLILSLVVTLQWINGLFFRFREPFKLETCRAFMNMSQILTNTLRFIQC